MDLRAPSADRHETLPRDQYLRLLDNASPKIRGGGSPKTFWGRKHAKFGSILHNFRLDREYLRNETRYQQEAKLSLG